MSFPCGLLAYCALQDVKGSTCLVQNQGVQCSWKSENRDIPMMNI